MVTVWTIWWSGFDSWLGLGIFSYPPCPDRLCDPLSLLPNGYRGPFSWE